MKAGKSIAFKESNSITFTLFATVAIFSTYTCMYAFRKAFSVAEFENQSFFGIDYKILLITSQVIGYTISKFVGIKIVSELKAYNRAKTILLLIGISGISLLFFALAQTPYNILFMFTSALPIGMIYGIIYSYLEGRKVTDILVMGLNLTMIVSSGFIKTIGKSILQSGVSETWMPFVTALLFVPLLILSVWMLEQFPRPTAADVVLKTKRNPMNRADRMRFIKNFTFGLIVFLIAYMLLTVLRDFRDNFSVEIWKELGFENNASIFSRTEIPIGIGVLILVSSIKFIKNNMLAFLTIHFVAMLGALLIGFGTLLFDLHYISPFIWSVLVGLGLYVSYIPANSLFFERLIASFCYISTASFMVTLADFYGYLGSVGVLFYKNFGNNDISYFQFFKTMSYFFSIALFFLFLFSMIYFYLKWRREASIETKILPSNTIDN
jgi:hypothetical protein